MDYIYNCFLKIYKISLIKWAIYINIICISIIFSYKLGTIIANIFKLLNFYN